MPRKRNPENKGLPARWVVHHGAYYYQVPEGLESMWDGKRKFRLGSSLPEAYKVWAERLDAPTTGTTVAKLLERYALQVVPEKAPSTRAHNAVAIKRLTAILGTAPISAVKPQLIYQYIDKRPAKTGARREIEVLSHAFTKAVEWGMIDRHPFKREVRLTGLKPRDRYVEDWEIAACLAIEPKRKKGGVLAAQAYVELKLLTGMARGDLLRMKVPDFDAEGIEIQRHKTANSSGKRTVYVWTDDLRAAVRKALAARPVHISPWLFCNRRGECYINEGTGRAGGWDSLWRGFMDRVLAETDVKDRFHEHDIRAKVGSDAEDVEHARALLSHASTETTRKIYRRKAERVMPLKSKNSG